MRLSDLSKGDCGIYKIECLANGKIYVSQSTKIQTRWTDHIRSLLRGNHPHKELLSDFQLYGLDSFDAEILEICAKTELEDKEKEWAKKIHDAGFYLYNLSSDGNIRRAVGLPFNP